MYRIGSSGWAYNSWIGPFYPLNHKSDNLLNLYSNVFNTVEIESTFYAMPDPKNLYKWYNETPDNFIFSPKLPKIITYDNILSNIENMFKSYTNSVRALDNKLGITLIQIPPFLDYNNGINRLKEFIKLFPEDLMFAIEFRNNTWLRNDVYSLLRDKNIILGWVERPEISISDILTSDNIYLRLMGDESVLHKKDFGSIKIDRTVEITEWADIIKKNYNNVKNIFIYANNHFQGFTPGTLNILMEKLGLGKINLKMDRQKTLF